MTESEQAIATAREQERAGESGRERGRQQRPRRIGIGTAALSAFCLWALLFYAAAGLCYVVCLPQLSREGKHAHTHTQADKYKGISSIISFNIVHFICVIVVFVLIPVSSSLSSLSEFTFLFFRLNCAPRGEDQLTVAEGAGEGAGEEEGEGEVEGKVKRVGAGEVAGAVDGQSCGISTH